jgi:hypothetical protein
MLAIWCGDSIPPMPFCWCCCEIEGDEVVIRSSWGLIETEEALELPEYLLVVGAAVAYW